MSKTKYYIDDSNHYIGGTDGGPLSENEVPHAPDDARQIWNGSDYDPVSAADLDAELDAKVDFANVDPFLKAYVLAVNDGSIVSGSNMTGAALKAAIKAKI